MLRVPPTFLRFALVSLGLYLPRFAISAEFDTPDAAKAAPMRALFEGDVAALKRTSAHPEYWIPVFEAFAESGKARAALVEELRKRWGGTAVDAVDELRPSLGTPLGTHWVINGDKAELLVTRYPEVGPVDRCKKDASGWKIDLTRHKKDEVAPSVAIINRSATITRQITNNVSSGKYASVSETLNAWHAAISSTSTRPTEK